MLGNDKEKLQREIDLHCDFNNYLLEKIEKAGKEIERLTKQNKALNEMYELTKKEYIRLNNIIKEVREYADKMLESYDSKGLLEILDKEKDNE